MKKPKMELPDELGWFCMNPKNTCVASGPERGDKVPDKCPACGGSELAVRAPPSKDRARTLEAANTRNAQLQRENNELRMGISQASLSRWIPVSERVPEAVYADDDSPTISGDVLVYSEMHGYEVANYDHQDRMFYSLSHGRVIEEQTYTHWMPLPEAPK